MNLPDFLAEDNEGFIHLFDHRIGLHHVARLYNEGYSPEMLLGQFPTLPLALIHKAIAFYLENQPDVDAYIMRHDRDIQNQIAAAPKGPGLVELRQRMKAIHHTEVF